MGSIKNAKINQNVLIAAHVKEELNGLFMLPPKYDEELEMLRYQYEHEEEIRMGLHGSTVTGATKSTCMYEIVVEMLYKDFYVKGKKPPREVERAFEIMQMRERSYPVGLKRIFEQGTNIGAKWQRLFIRGGMGIKENMDIPREVKRYGLVYTPDAIVNISGKDYVVEIKSQNSNGFQTSSSHPGGIKQLKLYMHFTGIRRGFVLVENKDTQDFKVLVETNIDESDKHVEKYIDFLEKARKAKKKAIRDRKIPKCNGTCKSVFCK